MTVEPAATAGDPQSFDACVIGSAVHGGNWLPAANAFVRDHSGVLAQRPVWLFSVGPLGTIDPAAIHEPGQIDAFRRLIGPREHHVFFGAHDRQSPEIEELPRLERFVARRFVTNGDFRDWRAIEAWGTAIGAALGDAVGAAPVATQ